MMNQREIIKYLHAPEMLQNSTVDYLEKLREDYPFFQTAHLLLIRNYKNLDSPRFTENLNFTAAYVSDRRMLYELLHSGVKVIQEPEEKVGNSYSKNRIITDNLKDNISQVLESQLNEYNNTKESEIDLIQIAIDVRKEYGKGIDLDDHDFAIRFEEEKVAVQEEIFEEVENKQELFEIEEKMVFLKLK
ncbi:MAG: hypothetical protein HC906_04710 [Bacteroidales bacterium]|nr:hypothetical protein [Bacteroidales bacterium]